MALVKTFRNDCPYCGLPYSLKMEVELKREGLTNYLIHPHKECNRFLVFIDPRGAIRGSQTIDSDLLDNEEEEKVDVNSYIKLFEDKENISDFYHIIDLNTPKTTGIITATKAKFHIFLRSKFYKSWMERFREENSEFSCMIVDGMIIGTINMYDMLILTAGIPIEQFDQDMTFTGIQGAKDFIKGKMVALCETIMSSQIA